MAVQLRRRLFAVIALAVIVLSATATVAAFGALSNGKGVPNRGTVKKGNVGVYWDNNCTNNTLSVDWGMLSPGTTNSVTLYVRNEGSVVAKLNLTTQNWKPLNASNFMGLTWSQEGQALNPGSVAVATLNLYVSTNISEITSFSFDIIIAAVAS